MKKPTGKFITIQRHKKEMAALQAVINDLKSMVSVTNEDNTNNLKSLRSAVNFTEELSTASSKKFAEMHAEIKDLRSRLDKVEPVILSFLTQEQKELAKILGISPIGYGVQYARLLYENRHIIHAARELH